MPINDQRSLRDQLADLATIADRFGLYDAADFVRERVRLIDGSGS